MNGAILHKLKAQHEEMAIAIRVLERMTGSTQTHKAMRNAAKAMNGNGHAKAPSLGNMTIKDAIPVALSAAGVPMKPPAIVELLRAGGRQCGDKISSVLTLLKKDKRIRRTKKGWLAA